MRGRDEVIVWPLLATWCIAMIIIVPGRHRVLVQNDVATSTLYMIAELLILLLLLPKISRIRAHTSLRSRRRVSRTLLVLAH
jgi:hypothetical protein